jgi:hypothetical protein
MRATKKDLVTVKISDKIAVDTTELQLLCGCERSTAVDIGTQAKARIQVGKRVLWNVSKVQKYLDSIATE